MVRVINLLILAVWSLLAMSCFNDDKPESSGETSGFLPGYGIVTYTGYAPLADRPVRIHYYIPVDGDMKKMPVLFVFAGLERNADDYLAAWRAEASNRGFMVFAFEFPEKSYSTSQYIEGGMFQGSSLLDRSEWTFSIVEAVFDAIRRDTGSLRNTYDMWGHSAGAQFVHRYVTFMPDARIDRAVCANAGWYTLPDVNIAYPYGLKNTDAATPSRLASLFARKLIVHLGTADANRSGLNTSAGAERQGSNRYQRGRYYFAEATRICSKGNYSLNWDQYEVAGVAHEFARMAVAGAQILY